MAGGNCPETPRQKMIGMMYLFYTALLALNVSGEVINAFVKINESIQKTTAGFSTKTRGLYATIDTKDNEQPGKYSELAKLAHEIEAESNELFQYIDDLKLEIIKKTEGEEATLETEITKKDDLNAANEVMIGGGKGKELRTKVETYRDRLLGVFKDPSSSKREQVSLTLATEDRLEGENKLFWEESFSKAMPLIGTVALLSKLQADIRNAEADVLEYMIADLEGLDIRITSLEGLVNAPKSFVIRGGEYTSTIFLGARDTSMRPTVYLTKSLPFYDSIVTDGVLEYKLRNGIHYDTLPIDETGKGLYSIQCGSVGNFKYGGLVHYKSNRGDMWLPYEAEYQVGDAGFTVSATKCNVLYRGLENPIAVSVDGYPRESVNVSASGGAQVRNVSGGGYIVTIPAGVSVKEVSINVSVRTDEGGRTLGSETFRVFDVPPPTINVAGTYKDGQRIPRVALQNSSYLTASLGGGFFPFDDVKYSINKFDFIYSVRGVAQRITVQGGKFDERVLSEIRRMGSGSQVSFSNIFYNGPSGTKQTNGVSVILE
ncbi:gliding motility protein GldM [Bacteroidales bacterium OttesenSCG-928-I21]|nr:gliding motility protein GldM [Bacteroidales bacterium OttesenSCG-928-I21]